DLARAAGRLPGSNRRAEIRIVKEKKAWGVECGTTIRRLSRSPTPHSPHPTQLDCSPMLSVFLLLMQSAGDPGPVYDGRAGQLDVRLPRIDTTITIDGRLDEPVWQR